MHDRVADVVLEPLQLPRDQGPVRPGAGVGDVEVVAALLGRELGAGLIGDPVTEGAGLALKLAALVAGLDPLRDVASGRRLYVVEAISKLATTRRVKTNQVGAEEEEESGKEEAASDKVPGLWTYHSDLRVVQQR